MNDVLSKKKNFIIEKIDTNTPARNGPNIQANCPNVANKALTQINCFLWNKRGIKELNAGWNNVLKQLLIKAKQPINNIFL